MKVIYYGHSCFAVQIGGHRLLFDPFITPNPLAKSVNVESIQADFILLSHGHEDHVADAVAIAKRTSATVIATFEVAVWLGKQGVQKVHPMNTGGGRQFDFGRVKMVNALHSSSLPDGTYAGNPVGFIIETSDGNFYYTGDTALTLDMKLIGETTSLKFAAMCIGDNFTMGVDDAIKAAEFVRCKEILGLHYDTFPPIKIDQQKARQQFKNAGLTLYLLPPGGTHEF